MNRIWHTLIVSILLGTLAYLLMYIAIPIIPIVPYMTLDFSGVPILLTFLLLGTKYGYAALLVKEDLHLILGGLSIGNLIGVFSDAIALIILAEVLVLILQKYGNHPIQAIMIATIAMTIGMAVANYGIITPLYVKVMRMKIQLPLAKLILFGVVPFNLIKGILVSGVSFLLLPRLAKVLNQKY